MSSDSPVAVVTGASSGIGRSIALALAESAYQVVCVDLERQSHDRSHGERIIPTDRVVSDGGGSSLFVQGDVSREPDVELAFRKTLQAFGQLDVLVNNAGIAQPYARIDAMSESDFSRVIGVNLTGVWLCCRAAIRIFVQSKRPGTIINIASIAGLVGFPEETAYCASKAAVIGLTRALALEVAELGVRVNAICPGYIHTSHLESMSVESSHPLAARSLEGFEAATPLGRLGEGADIGHLVAFLASDRADWATGAVWTIDGGFTAR